MDTALTVTIVREEMRRRDFSKRQLKILDLILEISLAIGKISAHVPKLSYWKAAGISDKHASEELEFLEQMQVILVDKTLHVVQIETDFTRWQVTPVRARWAVGLLEELLQINQNSPTIDLKCPDKGGISPKKDGGTGAPALS